MLPSPKTFKYSPDATFDAPKYTEIFFENFTLFLAREVWGVVAMLVF